MKRIFSILLLVAMFCAVLPMSASAAEIDTTKPVAQAVYGTPTIDGTIEEAWNAATPNKLEKAYVSTGSYNTSGAQFRVMWDENYLYFLVEVTDPTFGTLAQEKEVPAGSLYPRDSLSFTFTPDYNRDATTTQVAPSFWFILGAYGTTANFNNVPAGVFISEGEGEALTKNFAHSYNADGNGYVLELKVNLKLRYADMKMEAGTLIGFDLYTNDDQFPQSNTHGRVYGLTWTGNNNSYKNNSEKGTIELLAKAEETPDTSDFEIVLPIVGAALAVVAFGSLAFIPMKKKLNG